MNATTNNMLKTKPQLLGSISIPGVTGMIGITSSLGLRDENIFNCKMTLLQDLAALRDWGTFLVITFLDECELRALWGGQLGDHILALNMAWLHLPPGTMSFPDEIAKVKWHATVLTVCNLLRQGQRVVVHCKEGIGRAGLITVRVMMELGVPAAEAIRIVRDVRPDSLSISAQESGACCQDGTLYGPMTGKQPPGNVSSYQG